MPRLQNILLILEHYDAQIHHGVARYAGERRWHLNVDMVKTGRIPIGWRGDRIITSLGSRPNLIRYIRKAPQPKVDVVIRRPDIKIPRVVSDNDLIGRMAAQHFLERGARHFAWFSFDFFNVESLRFNGYQQALAKHGFECHKLIWSEGHRPKDNSTWREMRTWMKCELDKLPQPLAVFAFNDYDAAWLIDMGVFYNISVPEQVAVLGVDNIEMVCECLPVQLSSIQRDMERIGYEAAALLDRMLDGEVAPDRPILIPPKGIITRQSTDYFAVNQPNLRRAFLFIREHIHESIGNSEIASAAGLSRRSLEKLFKGELGRSVHEEIMRQRMHRVCELLAESDHPIGRIAELTGFCHAPLLNNAFRKMAGLSPMKYRRKYQIE